MIIDIDIHDDTGQLTDKQCELIEEILKAAAKYESVVEDSEVSVSFVDDEAIKEINRQYRDKDMPTDVISFALNDDHSDQIKGEDIPNLLGDIIISYPRAARQAEEYGHSLERELGFLVVHGFLHLLGYDHLSEDDEKTMFTKQEEILEAYGLQK